MSPRNVKVVALRQRFTRKQFLRDFENPFLGDRGVARLEERAVLSEQLTKLREHPSSPIHKGLAPVNFGQLKYNIGVIARAMLHEVSHIEEAL